MAVVSESNEVIHLPSLTALDRCDSECSAQALVRFTHDSGKELMFCGHHSNRHHPALIASRFIITEDNRESLS